MVLLYLYLKILLPWRQRRKRLQMCVRHDSSFQLIQENKVMISKCITSFIECLRSVDVSVKEFTTKTHEICDAIEGWR